MMTAGSVKKLQKGSCHCGAVEYEVYTNLEDEGIGRCNCSFCHNKNSYFKAVDPTQLKITKGKDNLGVYQFATKGLSHYHCNTCSIYVYTNGAIGGHAYTGIMVHTLKDVNLEGLKVTYFNGKGDFSVMKTGTYSW